MKIPLEWLKEYVDIRVRPEELADRLTMAGLEVGAIEYHGKDVTGVVVGKVKSTERLPSDHHLICQIDIGKKIIPVITEDLTIKVGEKIPVALEGAKIAGGITIKKTELHGVETFGYLCRPHELGIYEQEYVLRLPLDATLGEDVKKYLGLGGCVLDVDVLPNRGDCLSVLGVAREVSAVLNRKLQITNYKLPKTKNVNPAITVEIKDKELCPRYMARLIENVYVKDSPEWLKNRLLLAGLRPINNIVDATNYMLIELGQPMHAFDAAKIQDNKIVVRKASTGEKITTLDGVERKLEAGMLVIADAARAIAMAGVMGGANTEVSNSTTKVVLESAYFNPVSISKTSKAAKLRTEASVRFEKGVDWDMVEEALDRAADMIAELSGGKVSPYKVDAKGKERRPRILELRQDRISKILGTPVSIKEAVEILKRLGFGKIKTIGKKLKVEVPPWRNQDIEREIDLIEEVSRIYGYDRIKASKPQVKSDDIAENLNYALQKKIKEILVGCGLFETQTFSLVDQKMVDDKAVVISNPMTAEESVLRTKMLPSLLKVVSHNIRHQVEEVKIFEISKVFIPGKGKLPDEKAVLAGAIADQNFNFYKIKGIMENLLSEFSNDLKLESVSDREFHPGKSAAILVGPKAKYLGKFGALHPDVLKKWGIKQDVYAFELEIEPLFDLLKAPKCYKPLPKFPKVERDLAMFVPEGLASKAITDLILSAGGDLIEDICLFDRYKNSQAYRISFRDPSKTLTDEVVNQKFLDIQEELSNKLKVQIRK
jgi:phenylalanyl-tRNA synthetase beta chain